MDTYGSRRTHVSRSRARQNARQQRRERLEAVTNAVPGLERLAISEEMRRRIALTVGDVFWRVTHTPQLMMGMSALALIVFLIFVGSHIFSGRIFPNVWVTGIPVGDLTVQEAAALLEQRWEKEAQITLIDGSRTWTAAPRELGITLDSLETAQSARGAGLAGIPFGFGVAPAISLNYETAQDFLLDLVNATDIAPQNASFRWDGEQLVGVSGSNGRMLDVPRTMERLQEDPIQVVQTGRLNLVMAVLPPEVDDPASYLKEAREVAGLSFTFTGYDPFSDEILRWSTSKEVFASWMEVNETGLTLRDETYEPFVEALTRSLNSPDRPVRYIDPKEAREKLDAAINDQNPAVNLRIRYRDSQYTVVSGDSGYRIARKTGVPYYLLAEANPGWDLGKLSPGDVIALPTRDKALPLEPVPNKRIVVDLDKQTLTAFENGQVKFHWLVSSGMDSAPTSPGIYQILTHDEVAKGSSYTLCSSAYSCGQWEMYWFMGIYEVIPGLMNGFHGAVLLPNGAYLGGGNVGSPYTFGCVMSQNDHAKNLYDWAEAGTVVEIISSEFAPVSPLGQLASSMNRPV
jgi:LysM repeat protein